MTESLVVATRASKLALAQTRAFVAAFQARYPDIEVSERLVTTSGDRIQDRPLYEIGGKGLFLKEIEQALLDREADFAVHSLKDVPAELAPTLTLACIPLREDPRDVLISATGLTLSALPPGASIGTSSLRRRAQLSVLAPSLNIVPLRGNVDTRLRKCREGVVDATILAHAGLLRLGLSDVATQLLSVAECLPAVGQGALAIETRAEDRRAVELLRSFGHADSARAVAAERGVMRAVEGGCHLPLAAYAVRDGAELWLRGMLANEDGTRLRRLERRIPWPEDDAESERCGFELGQALRDAS